MCFVFVYYLFCVVVFVRRIFRRVLCLFLFLFLVVLCVFVFLIRCCCLFLLLSVVMLLLFMLRVLLRRCKRCFGLLRIWDRNCLSILLVLVVLLLVCCVCCCCLRIECLCVCDV